MLQLLNAMSLPTGIKETVSVLSSDPSNKGGKARFTMVPLNLIVIKVFQIVVTS